MAKPRVVRSIEAIDGLRCVDVFARSDGSFGFEEYRRDPEDRSGWRPVGGFVALRYGSYGDALKRAQASIHWLTDVPGEHQDKRKAI